MGNFLSQLTRSEQARLLEELNYMNLEEIRGFCSERGIPFRIVAEYTNGKMRATKDTDRKPIVLAPVRRYLANLLIIFETSGLRNEFCEISDAGAGPGGRDAFQKFANQEQKYNGRSFFRRPDDDRTDGGNRHQHLD